MKKIKFRIEYVPLSDDRIERHKNFDKLMAAYTAHPRPDWKSRLFKNKYLVYAGGVITGAAIATLFWWNVNIPDKKEQQAQQQNALAHQLGNNKPKGGTENLAAAEERLTEDSIIKSKTSEKIASVRNSSPSGRASVDRPGELAAKKVKPEIALIQQQVTEKAEADEMASGEMSKISQEAPSIEARPSIAIPGNDTIAPSIENASSENPAEIPYQKSSSDSVNQLLYGSPSSEKSIWPDTLVLNSEVTAAKTGIPFSSIPEDSSRKKINVKLPGIDWNDEINASKAALAKVADSISKKTGSLLSRLFQEDSIKEGSSPKEISALDSVQDPVQDSFKHRFAQASIVSPAGSDGKNAKEYSHNISLNIFQGYNGALDGVEFGGLANIERGYVTGVQFGGLTNFAFGNVKGAQFGGLLNHGKNLEGAQFSGLTAIASGTMHGVQVAGITSIAVDTFNGLQLGGVLNLAVAKKPSSGWQFAGISNVSLGSLKGGQVASVLNVATRIHGTQIGLINFSNHIHGFQLGLINIADSIAGDALGLLSFSGNGMHHLDVFGSEILYGGFGLKFGSPHIYNIFAAGVAPLNNTTRIGLGIGVGGHFPISRVFINIDGMCWSIHNNDLRDWNYVNLWNQIRLMAGYKFTKGLGVYAGPTANVQVYHYTYLPVAPYTMFDSQGNTNVQGWIGFVAGIQFF